MSSKTDINKQQSITSYPEQEIIRNKAEMRKNPVSNWRDISAVVLGVDRPDELNEKVKRFNAYGVRGKITPSKSSALIPQIDKKGDIVKDENNQVAVKVAEITSLERKGANVAMPTCCITSSRVANKMLDYILIQAREQIYFNNGEQGNSDRFVRFSLHSLVGCGWYANESNARRAFWEARSKLRWLGVYSDKGNKKVDFQYFPGWAIVDGICIVEFNSAFRWSEVMKLAVPTPMWVLAETKKEREYQLITYILRMAQVNVMKKYNSVIDAWKEKNKDTVIAKDTAISKILNNDHKFRFVIRVDTISETVLDLPRVGAENKNPKRDIADVIINSVKKLNELSEQYGSGIELSIRKRYSRKGIEDWLCENALDVALSAEYVKQVVETTIGDSAE